MLPEDFHQFHNAAVGNPAALVRHGVIVHPAYSHAIAKVIQVALLYDHLLGGSVDMMSSNSFLDAYFSWPRVRVPLGISFRRLSRDSRWWAMVIMA